MSKLEEIARALEEHVKRNGFSSYEDAALVAIRAMREPTDEMAERGSSSAEDDLGIRWGIGAVECATVYRAMIDAALPAQPIEEK